MFHVPDADALAVGRAFLSATYLERKKTLEEQSRVKVDGSNADRQTALMPFEGYLVNIYLGQHDECLARVGLKKVDDDYITVQIVFEPPAVIPLQKQMIKIALECVSGIRHADDIS